MYTVTVTNGTGGKAIAAASKNGSNIQGVAQATNAADAAREAIIDQARGELARDHAAAQARLPIGERDPIPAVPLASDIWPDTRT